MMFTGGHRHDAEPAYWKKVLHIVFYEHDRVTGKIC